MSLPETLSEHLRAPRNQGRPAGAHNTGRGENAACGDVLLLHLVLAEGRILEARFEARACSGVIALASLATEVLRGMSREQAQSFDAAVLAARAGGLPPTRAHATAVLQRALAQALESCGSD